MSVINLLGLPDAFTSLVLTLTLALLLAPYFSGVKLGPITPPVLSRRTNKRLRIVAPILLAAELCAYLPILPARQPQVPPAVTAATPVTTPIKPAAPPAMPTRVSQPKPAAAQPVKVNHAAAAPLHTVVVFHSAEVGLAQFTVDDSKTTPLERTDNTTKLRLPAGTHTIRALLSGQDCSTQAAVPETSRTFIECRPVSAGGRAP